MDSFEIGRELTALALGIDRYERSRPAGSTPMGGDGLVPIYLGGDSIVPMDLADPEQMRAALSRLDTATAGSEAGPRQVFLEDMLRSLRVVVRMLDGITPSFEEKVEVLVGAPAGREDPAVIEDARGRLDRLLRQSGFITGRLGQRVAAWEAARAIPAEAVATVFRELMAGAKARTDSMIFDTGGYDMALNPVRGTFYTARCSFDAGKMDLNMDMRFTRADLKHLVCHEVYPGHSTQLLYTKAEVDAGRAPADALLITADAVTGCVQEGIGDQGVQLIDFVEDADDEVFIQLRRIRSAAQTSAAWMLMVEGLPRESVADYLRTVAMGQEAWIEGRLRMAAHPFRGPFISSYWAGDETVRRVRERVGAAQWPGFLTTLFGRANSPRSLSMFPATAG